MAAEGTLKAIEQIKSVTGEQCFLGGMLFDWNYREPLLFLACLFAGMVLLGIFRIIELLEQR